MIVECTGHTVWACEVIDAAVRAGLPIVTMNSAFHVAAGSFYVGKGLISESEGDQPGSEAALGREAVEMGFTPIVYGSMKGYLNPSPSPEDMEAWSRKQGISLGMVTSFTDGTKLHIEQALVGNGLGATCAPGGLVGPKSGDLETGVRALGAVSRECRAPITDYVLSPKLSHGVFVLASHRPEQREALHYFKAGGGPEYLLVKPAIFGHLETPRTIRQLMTQRTVLLDNSPRPRLSVNTIGKRFLPAGHRIACGVGSFDVRGEVVRIKDNKGHLPIALVYDAVTRQACEPGQVLSFADIDMPDSRAAKAWQAIESDAIQHLPCSVEDPASEGTGQGVVENVQGIGGADAVRRVFGG